MFNPDAFNTLINGAPKRRFRKGVVLIHEGDRGNTIYAVIRGSVRSYSASWDEKEITFGVFGPGMLFGEMALDGEPRSASVETLEPTECAIIENDLLVKHLSSNPTFALELVKLVILRAREATLAARNMALMDVYGRLKFFLEHAPATVTGTARALDQRFTQREIAHRVGSSREMVSRIFKDLESGGYLTTKAGSIVVTRPIPNDW